jgi:hypothetical protein
MEVPVFENAKSFGPPRSYTLSLTVNNQSPAAIVWPGVIRARLKAGTGAGYEEFEVDWRNGVSVGVNASMLTVFARQDGPYATSVVLGATLAEGASLARSTAPTWSTLRATYLAIDPAVRFSVPRRAKTVRIVDMLGVISPMRIAMIQLADPLFVTLDVYQLPGEQLLRTGVMLPTNCTHVDVSAVGANTSAIVEFGLDC